MELDLAPAANKGFVVLKVVAVRPISILNPKWQSIRVSSNGRDEEISDITMHSTMFMGNGVVTESVYFAKLDAGDYDVTGMGSIGPGPGLLLALLASDQASADKKLPKFTVGAGRLANLGTIVYVPEMDKEQPARMFLLNGPAGKQSAKNALLAESRKTELTLPEGGGWMSSSTATDEAAMLAQARPFVSMLSLRKSDRGLLAGAHLGQIFRRTGPQTWSGITVDTLNRIVAVAEAANGRIIAAGEYGEFFVQSASGAWGTYRLGNETSRIAYIEPRADGSALFLTGEFLKTRVLLKKVPEDKAEVPTEVATIDCPPFSLAPISTANELVLACNVPGISRETNITRIDKQTLAVKSQLENFWVLDWQYIADGEIKLTRQNGLSFYNSTSTDNAKTWLHSEDKANFSNYWNDKMRGFGLDISPGFTMVSNTLRKTEDGGKTWSNIGNPLDTKHFAGKIVHADPTEVMIQGSQMLYSTIDQGQTWKRIFPPQKQ